MAMLDFNHLLLLLAVVTHSKGCDVTYTIPSGTITSPNWPKKYDNNMDCTYIIDVPNGIAIHISVVVFETETNTDVRDGDILYYGLGKNADISKAEGELSGYRDPQSFIMNTGTMWLRFISNDRTTYNGFQLNYVATTSCGGFSSEQSGNFSSPNYPGDYPDDVSCQYVVDVPGTVGFDIEFLDFKLAPFTDLLYYGNGTSPKTEEAIGILTGLGIPHPLEIRDQTVWFIFESDDSVTYNGFLLKWRAIVGIPGSFSPPSSGRPTTVAASSSVTRQSTPSTSPSTSCKQTTSAAFTSITQATSKVTDDFKAPNNPVIAVSIIVSLVLCCIILLILLCICFMKSGNCSKAPRQDKESVVSTNDHVIAKTSGNNTDSNIRPEGTVTIIRDQSVDNTAACDPITIHITFGVNSVSGQSSSQHTQPIQKLLSEAACKGNINVVISAPSKDLEESSPMVIVGDQGDNECTHSQNPDVIPTYEDMNLAENSTIHHEYLIQSSSNICDTAKVADHAYINSICRGY